MAEDLPAIDILYFTYSINYYILQYDIVILVFEKKTICNLLIKRINSDVIAKLLCGKGIRRNKMNLRVIAWLAGAWLGVIAAGVELPLNRFRVAGPIPEAQLVESEADRFLAQDMESVCGFKVQEYVNPRNPDVDGLFFLEFFDRIPEGRAVAYAATEVEMTAPCRYLMKLNTDFDVEVYINGEMTFKTKGPSFGNLFFVDFKTGKNRIAIKSPHEKGFWAVVLSAIDGPLTSEEEIRRAEAWMRVAGIVGKFSNNQPAIDGFWIGSAGKQPELKWMDEENARLFFGDEPPEISWFDSQMQPCVDFERQGLYYALIEDTKTAFGKPYKALYAYYLMPGEWREHPKIIAIEKALRYNEPFDWFSSNWGMNPERLKCYLEEGDRNALDEMFRADVSQNLLDWRQQNYPVEQVKLAPPIELENPAPTLRYGSCSEAGFKPGSELAFDELCRQWFEESQTPFYTIIARNGVIVYSKGYGELNGEPMSPDTRCSMASISKLFTGIMFAPFIDQRLIDLDEDMRRFMPALANTPEWQLTPRRCFNHTCNFDGHGNFGGIRNIFADYGIALWLPGVQPGSECNYNGVGPNLMAMYMMYATGTPINKLFQDYYFRHLGITTIKGDDQGGGYVAGAMDMAKLAQLLLNKGTYGKWRFFSPNTYNDMMPRDLLKDNPGLKLTTTWFYGHYGVGIHPFSNPSGESDKPIYYGHGSATYSVFLFDPVHQTMIIQARNSNRTPEINDKFRYRIEELVWKSIAAE